MHRREAFAVRTLLASLAVTLLAARPAPAEGPAFLVRDINTTPAVRDGYEDEPSSLPRDFVALDGVVYFAAGDIYDAYGEGPNGNELWRTDGTAAGTRLVVDLRPGPASSYPIGLQAWNGSLYFVAADSDGQIGFWRSDGTAAGTELVATTGAQGYPRGLARIGSRWIFIVANGWGTRLWQVDGGDAAVIAELSDLEYISDTSEIVLGDSAAYFISSAPHSLLAVYRTDGTPAGTRAVFHGPLGSTPPSGLSVVGDTAFFVADDLEHGAELWRADESGAALVTDLVEGEYGSWPSSVGSIGSALLFVTEKFDGNGAGELAYLWRTDGTSAGTEVIATLPSRPSGPPALLGGALYFGAGPQIWRTDGTSLGTQRVQDFPVREGYWGTVQVAVSGGQLLALFDSEGSDTVQLWSSDGTRQGARLVKELYWITDHSLDAFEGATAGDGSFIFAADGGSGIEPWRSDGTSAGTALLAEINPGATDLYNVYDNAPPVFADLAGTLAFTADDRVSQSYLWRSDATDSGTRLIPDAVEQPYYTPTLMAVGSHLFYTLGEAQYGTELWELASLDGPGRLLADINRGPDSSYIAPFAVLEGELIMVADDGEHGMELWAPYDRGLVADIDPGVSSSSPRQPAILNGLLYFLANGGALWRTDGTAAGTEEVADIGAGYDAQMISGPDRLAISTASTGLAALFFSDGTSQGTVRVGEIGPAGDGETRRAFAFAGSTLVFSAADGLHGIELWRSDGTAAGTALLADIYPGQASARPMSELSRGDAVLFFADDGVHGREPWITDGTAAGTSLLADIRAGALSSRAADVGPATHVGDVFLFAASNGVDGLELWRSDGSAAGTSMVQDIAPATRSSSPNTFTISGEFLYFTANDNEHGRELWALPLADLGCSNGCPDPNIPTPTPRRTPRPVWTAGTPPPTFTATGTPAPRTTPHCEQAGGGPDCVFMSVGSASGVPGDHVEIAVRLRSDGLPVAGVQLDIHAPPGLHLSEKPNGEPDCWVNPAIDKDATAFRAVSDNSAVLRALVIAVDNVDPLPPEALLFTCAYDIAVDALPGTLELDCRNYRGSDPAGTAITSSDESDYFSIGEMVCTGGTVIVSVSSPVPTGTPLGSVGDSVASSDGGGCQIERGSGSSSFVLLLLPPLLLLLRRR